MKIARLTIVTENQISLYKAQRLATIISETITAYNNFHIDRYEKFDNSYKIDFIVEFDNPERSIIESLEKTDKLCSPWNVRLIQNNNEIELTFNKTTDTTYSKNEFNVIVWAHWAVEN